MLTSDTDCKAHKIENNCCTESRRLKKNENYLPTQKSANIVHKSVNAATVLAALWRPLSHKDTATTTTTTTILN